MEQIEVQPGQSRRRSKNVGKRSTRQWNMRNRKFNGKSKKNKSRCLSKPYLNKRKKVVEERRQKEEEHKKQLEEKEKEHLHQKATELEKQRE